MVLQFWPLRLEFYLSFDMTLCTFYNVQIHYILSCDTFGLRSQDTLSGERAECKRGNCQESQRYTYYRLMVGASFEKKKKKMCKYLTEWQESQTCQWWMVLD